MASELIIGSNDVSLVLLANKLDTEAFSNECQFSYFLVLVHSCCKYVMVLVAY